MICDKEHRCIMPINGQDKIINAKGKVLDGGIKNSRVQEVTPTTGIPSVDGKLQSMMDDLVAGRLNFESSPVASIDGSHIVAEFIDYVHRPNTANRLVSEFERRISARSVSRSPMDKALNDFIALPGIPGSGKSTFFAHFPCSVEYQKYASSRSEKKPLVSLITFNSAMGIADTGVAPGLRVLYGALCASCGIKVRWSDFEEKHAALQDMTILTATRLLRSVFGEDRPVLLCVDELSKIDDHPGARLTSKHVIADLCCTLNEYGFVDIVVSALTPSYIDGCLDGGRQRSIAYIPITPLSAVDLCEAFRASGEKLVDAVQKMRSTIPRRKPIDIVLANTLQNLYILASGHPRTVEMLQDEIQHEEGLWDIVLDLGASPAPTPYQLLRKVCRESVFTLYFKPLSNEAERERILSLQPRNVINDRVSREMLEGAHCTIHSEQDGEFLLTTSVASFFLMLDDIRECDPAQLGPLSRAVLALFQPQRASHDVTIAQLWERAHCLAMVAHVHDTLADSYKGAVLDISSLFGLQTNFEFGCDVALGSDLRVVLATKDDAMPWQRDVLYVAPPHEHAGFNHMLCLLGADAQEEIQLCVAVDMTKNAGNLHETMGNKLLLTLQHHVQHAGLEDKPVAEQLAALGSVYFVLSIYGSELQGDMNELKSQVVTYLEKLDKPVNLKEMLCGFIAAHWDTHVAFQGTSEMDASMLPVTLPFAQLVQAVVPDDE